MGSLAVAAVVGLIVVAAAQQLATTPANPLAVRRLPRPVRAHYVGAAACASCHAREYAAWRGSQHQQAMQHAAAGTVLGDFANAKFSYAGITSTF